MGKALLKDGRGDIVQRANSYSEKLHPPGEANVGDRYTLLIKRVGWRFQLIFPAPDGFQWRNTLVCCF